MKESFISRVFRDDSYDVIDKVNEICEDYAQQGFDLTLRQLYYQFVARGLIPNKDTEYKRLGSIVNDGRLAGLIDWDYIVDRTRFLRSLSHFAGQGDAVSYVAARYREDVWADQPVRLEVWIEKDALVGVIEGPCNQWRVPFFSCRGYVSQSEMYDAAMRLIDHEMTGQTVAIIHLGDHDPSGIDMTRDIEDRLSLFGANFSMNRIALNMAQIQQFNPPPNPAKVTDSRARDYIARFGHQSWELDALDPATLSGLVDQTIQAYVSPALFRQALAKEGANRQQLETLAATLP